MDGCSSNEVLPQAARRQTNPLLSLWMTPPVVISMPLLKCHPQIGQRAAQNLRTCATLRCHSEYESLPKLSEAFGTAHG